MEQAEIKYFDSKFESLDKKIDAIATRQEKDIEHHREDLDDLFRRTGKCETKIATMETEMGNHAKLHADSAGNSKWNKEMLILIAIFALGEIKDFITPLFG